mgnify:CR=1 FL=1
MSSIPNFTDIPWQTHASGTLAGWQEKAQQEDAIVPSATAADAAPPALIAEPRVPGTADIAAPQHEALELLRGLQIACHRQGEGEGARGGRT